MFKQSSDGAFEAFPVEEWYNFAPVSKYKSLNAEVYLPVFSPRELNVNILPTFEANYYEHGKHFPDPSTNKHILCCGQPWV